MIFLPQRDEMLVIKKVNEQISPGGAGIFQSYQP